MALHCAGTSTIILPSSQYDLNNVEKDVKYKIIIIISSPDKVITEVIILDIFVTFIFRSKHILWIHTGIASR